MKELLFSYLQAGIWGGITIAFVLLLRLPLKNAPKKVVCLLWLLAALRLALPFSIASTLSVQPDIPEIPLILQSEMAQPQSPPLQIPQSATPGSAAPTPQPDIGQILSFIWLGVCLMLVFYTGISYLHLRFQVRHADRCPEGVYEYSFINSAFLLGYLHPRIYMPAGIPNGDRFFVIAHERAHLRNGDQWWKLIGFLCVCLHWYNPLAWIGYAFFCRDIEIACDERVIRQMDLEQRKAYSMALLNYSRRISTYAACPVAFGEVSLKPRIKNILSYRRPGVVISIASVTLAALVALCFLTAPVSAQSGNILPDFSVQETPQETELIPASEKQPDIKPEAEPAKPEPKPTTKPSGTTQKPSNPSGGNSGSNHQLASKLDGVDTAPAADTPGHGHSYSSQVISPSCDLSGYTLYTCVCGHTYYDHLVSPAGHAWVFVSELGATDTEDGYKYYKCDKCIDTKREVTELSYVSSLNLPKVDTSATKYAADRGFETLDNHPNTAVKCFTYVLMLPNIKLKGDQSYLLKQAKAAVDDAYDYCKENNYSVSNSTLWIQIQSASSDRITIRVYCAGAN